MPVPSSLERPFPRTPPAAVDAGHATASGGVRTGSPPMRRVVRTVRGPALQWELRRNCSFTPRQVMMSFLLLCGIDLSVAAGFWLVGFPLIALFSALELSAFAVALLHYGRHACDREVVTLHPDCLSVDSQCGTRVRHTELQPAWVRVTPAAGEDALVSLCGHGVEVRVGRYVRPQLRDTMARELRQALLAAPGHGPTGAEPAASHA